MKILLIFALIGLLLRFPGSSKQAAVSALRIWGLDVVPSLFPYMVLSRTLASVFSTQGISTGPAVWILGLLGGSPSGAAVLSTCSSTMPKRKLLALAALTGCISPMFLLYTTAGWAHDALFGKLLLIAHLVSALLAYWFVLALCRNTELAASASDLNSKTENPITQSVSSVLNVGGCIVFFSVIASAMTELLPFLTDTQQALMHGILEISGGLHALLLSEMPIMPKYILCAGLAGFGGLSILFQNHLFLRNSGVKFSELLVFGFIRALISSGLMAIMLVVVT